VKLIVVVIGFATCPTDFNNGLSVFE
jgi:hypothetical protein